MEREEKEGGRDGWREVSDKVRAVGDNINQLQCTESSTSTLYLVVLGASSPAVWLAVAGVCCSVGQRWWLQWPPLRKCCWTLGYYHHQHHDGSDRCVWCVSMNTDY